MDLNPNPEERTIESVIRYHLDPLKIDFESFCKTLREKLVYFSANTESSAKEDFYKYYLSHSTSSYKSKKTQKYSIWKSIIRILHFEYNITCDLFGYTLNEFENTKFPQLISDNSKPVQPRAAKYEVYELQADPDGQTQKVEFEKTYYSYLKPALTNMQKELIVFEYIEDVKYKDPNTLDAYYTSHYNIYNDIENTLNHVKNFKYIRFLTLPLHHKLSSLEFNPYENKKHKKELLSEIIKYISPSLFTHIYRCMVLKGANFDKDHSGFFLVARPSRSYLWGIVDEGNFIITEYYKYKQGSNKCEPNLLFVEEKGMGPNILYDIYNKDRKRLISTKRYQYNNPRINTSDFTQSNLEKILEGLVSELETEFINAKNQKDKNLEDYNSAKIYLAQAKEKLDIIKHYPKLERRV